MSSQPGGASFVVMAVQRGLVVGVRVAEQLAEPLRIRHRRVDEAVEVVVPDLVAEVAEQGAVRLVHLLLQLFAVYVVAFGEIQRDDAVFVAGEHLLELAGEQVERQPVLGVLVAPDDGQFQFDQLGDQPPLGLLRPRQTPPSPWCRHHSGGFGSTHTTCIAAERAPSPPANCIRPDEDWRTIGTDSSRRHRHDRCPARTR